MRLTHFLLVSTVLLPLSLPAQTRLTITLYESANLQPAVVQGMMKETSRIFQAASVEVEWVECELAGKPMNLSLCSEHLGPNRFMLQLVSGTNKTKPRTSGLAVLQNGSGVYACLYPDRINELARDTNWDLADLLGHAAAHEIGHLLLGTSAHASAGIMRAKWETEDLRHLSHEGLTFLRGQIAAVRAATVRPPAGR